MSVICVTPAYVSHLSFFVIISLIFFIPTILLIGFFAGAASTPYISALRERLQSGKKQTTDLQAAKPPSVSERFVLGALVVFVAVFIATHLFTLPNSLMAVKNVNGGLPLFDQSPSFIFSGGGVPASHGIRTAGKGSLSTIRVYYRPDLPADLPRLPDLSRLFRGGENYGCRTV